jgi:hypothetical protein
MKNINLKLLILLIILASSTLLGQQEEENPPSESVVSDSLATGEEEAQEDEVREFSYFILNPKLGMTFFNSSRDGEEISNLQWLAGLDIKFTSEGSFFQFSSQLYANYGQLHTLDNPPEKTQDVLILTLMPSITLINHPSIRLFLETTAETDMGEGFIDDRPTSFLDPVFLYQSLFLGQKHFVINADDKSTFELTYGVGYAFQQTLTKDFKLDTLESGSTPDNFESGFSAIFHIMVDTELFNNVSFKTDFKAVALSKQDFFQNINSSRCTMLGNAGIYYKMIGIEYNINVLYDINYSDRRQLEQSLMLTMNLEIP